MDIKKKVGCALLLLLSALAGASAPAAADMKDFLNSLANMGNPRLEIPINHPPSLPLKVTGVALAPPEGQCSDPLAAQVEEDFVNSGVAVIDRAHLNAVLAEHKLQVSGIVDQKTAAKVGALLGAQALIFLKVMDCSVGKGQKQEAIMVNNRPVVDYVTEGIVSGSIRIIDLTTGRVIAAQHVEGKSRLTSQEGYPSDHESIDQAQKVAATAVHRMFFPWTETKSLVYFDDSACGLNVANKMLKAKDLEGAMQKAGSNLEECQNKPNVKPAVLAHAYYDIGILQVLKGDYDHALTNLSEASKLDSNKVILDAMAECRTAKESAVALARYQDEQATANPNSTPARARSVADDKAGHSIKQAALSPEERLQQLEGLLKKKLITQAEYDQKRAKILSEM